MLNQGNKKKRIKRGNKAWGASCSPNAFATEFEGKIEKMELKQREPRAQPILFQGNKKK